MLTDDTIKQIFFLSDKPRKDALIANEVDIIQFGKNVAEYAALSARKAEHQRCVDIARSHNRQVAELLEYYKP